MRADHKQQQGKARETGDVGESYEIVQMPDRRRLLMMIAASLGAPLLPVSRRGLSAAEALSLGAFIAFSEQLLGKELVPPDMAEKAYAIFRQEPWGIDHLLRLRRKFMFSSNSPQQALASLDEGERWFLEHFLTTWITGVYYHQSGNHMLSYEHALMHAALVDIRPVPGLSDRDFGFWEQAPAGMDKAVRHG